MGARVPQELADAIIDTLHDNTHALTQCSLVCRAWVSSTRYHLFSHVDLAYEKKLSPFLEILAADLCTVIPFVKEITMRYDFAMRPTVSGGLEVATSTLLQHLSSVVSMHLYHFTSPIIPFFADLLPRFPMLAQLELVLMECDSLSRLCRLLDGCAALTSLRMDRIAWPPASAESSTYLRACSIRTLCLDVKASFLDAFMRGTRDEPEGLSCTTLLLSNITPDSVQSVQRFLRCIGSSLEDLSLTYEWVLPGSDLPEFWRHLLCRSTHLARLRLEFKVPDVRILTCITALLSSISSSRMASIAITFQLLWRPHLEYSDIVAAWSALDGVLSSTHLASIPTLDFEFKLGDGFKTDITALDTVVRHQLPRCGARVNVLKYRIPNRQCYPCY